MRERLRDIDRLKGLAILLVVLGHLMSRQVPGFDSVYTDLKLVIYSFHMPVFMFVSGFVLAYSRKPITGFTNYITYVRSKAYRLLPAYLLFALIIFAGKYSLNQYMHVDNPVHGLDDFITIFIDPLRSFSSYLWYIYTLFIYYVIFPFFYKLTNNKLYYMLPVGVVLGYLEVTQDVTHMFCISRVFAYFFVFTLGCLASDYYKDYIKILDKFDKYFVLAFIVVLIFVPKTYESRYVIGLFAIPALHVLCRSKLLEKDKLLSIFGDYTFPIYLMNTIFIGFTKGVFLYFMDLTIVNFLIMTPFLFIAGALGPVLTKKYIINRIPYVREWVR